jgi:hypothetical protein
VTRTFTDFVTEVPPVPAQVSVYVLSVVGAMVCVPLSAFTPAQLPPALHDATLLALHSNVVESPRSIAERAEVNVSVGPAGGGGGVTGLTVMDRDFTTGVDPVAPLHVRV